MGVDNLLFLYNTFLGGREEIDCQSVRQMNGRTDGREQDNDDKSKKIISNNSRENERRTHVLALIRCGVVLSSPLKSI